jgi:hypothetical protein
MKSSQMNETDENEDELYPEETVLDEVDAVIELFDVRPKRLGNELRRYLLRIVEEDEDDAELAAAVQVVYRKLTYRNQVRLIDLACGYWPAGPLVCGALLHEIADDREKIDELFKHVGDDILRWFRRAPLEALMTEEERRKLGALPSVINAYHQTGDPGPRVVLGPYWILPPAGAVPRSALEGGQLVRAQVPRSSVLVYREGSDNGDVPTVIVDFRRVEDVEVVTDRML